MIRLRLVPLAAGLALALSVFAAPAWAHPGHDSADAPAAGDALGQHSPPAAALIAGALAFLLAIPQRRRALALALVLLLATISLEGLAHAAMHLHKVRHAQSLAIGASAVLQAAARPDPEGPSATPVLRLAGVMELYDAPVPAVVVASNRGRSPPVTAA